MIFYVISKDLDKNFWCIYSLLVFTSLDPSWIRIHMDIYGILDLDPDPHENLCGSETLVGGREEGGQGVVGGLGGGLG